MIKQLKILGFCIILFLTIHIANASEEDYIFSNKKYSYLKHPHNESSYQHQWCFMHNGIEEYKNPDNTRVDCLTDTHAVEFDFAEKWAEGIGQALHYSFMTGKKAKLILILENTNKQMKYVEIAQNLGKINNFEVEYLTNTDIKTINGKCLFKDCKCHSKKKKNN